MCKFKEEKKLRKKVNELFRLEKSEDIFIQLRDICVYFLHNFGIKVGDKKIIPLRVEAYYHTFDNKTFAQLSKKGRYIVHCDKKSQNKWSVLHVYNVYRYKAVDICLSTGNNYFSLLLISASINGKDILKPSNIANELINNKYTNGSKVNLFSNHSNENEDAYSTPRNGIDLYGENENDNPLGVLICKEKCKYRLTQKNTKIIWQHK